MTDDDIVTVIQANKFSSDPLAIYRAVIAARDEELRKQEPVAYTFKQEGSPAYTNNPSFMKLNTQYVYEPLYAAPIPPTVLDTNLETATNRNYLESIGQLPPTEGSKP